MFATIDLMIDYSVCITVEKTIACLVLARFFLQYFAVFLSSLALKNTSIMQKVLDV